MTIYAQLPRGLCTSCGTEGWLYKATDGLAPLCGGCVRQREARTTYRSVPECKGCGQDVVAGTACPVCETRQRMD